MQWTYSVIVKSEASKKVSEAMKDLTSSQENAAQTFKEVNNILTNNFQENLLAALDERLLHWMEDDEEGSSIKDNFQKSKCFQITAPLPEPHPIFALSSMMYAQIPV